MEDLRELTLEEISEYLKNEDQYVEKYLEWSEKSVWEVEAYEVYEKYLEDFEEEFGTSRELVLTERQIEIALDEVRWQEQNTCERCSGSGCNWCLMVGY